MSLVFDRRAELGDRPGVHVLIAGVGRYPHLEDGDGPKARETFGLGQPIPAARTALRMRTWLEKNTDRLPVPLATIRLLVSGGEQPGIEPCTLENFLKATSDWHADALRHRDGVTWLYLVGNSLQFRSRDHHVFLLQDFGDGVGPLLRNGVNVSNIISGMSPARGDDSIARTQWYFLDLGRKFATGVDELQWQNSTAVFDTDLPGIEDREAAVYHASEVGEGAYGITAGHSFYSDALIECLEGTAEGVAVQADDGRWCVRSTSLLEGFQRSLSRLTAPYRLEQHAVASGSIRNGILCYLDGPPVVEFHIDVRTRDGRAPRTVEIFDAANTAVHTFAADASGEQLRVNVPAGIYRVKVVEASPGERVVNRLAMINGPTTLRIDFDGV